jgi:hypothetical protein
VAGAVLHVAKADTGVERKRDEAVPERVGADLFRDAGLAGDAAHDVVGGEPVHHLASRGLEERGPLLGRQASGRSPHTSTAQAGRRSFAALAHDAERAVAAFLAHVLHPSGQRPADAKRLHGEQPAQGAIASAALFG